MAIWKILDWVAAPMPHEPYAYVRSMFKLINKKSKQFQTEQWKFNVKANV